MFDYITEFDITPSEYFVDDFGNMVPDDGDEHYVGLGEWAEIVDGVMVKNYHG